MLSACLQNAEYVTNPATLQVGADRPSLDVANFVTNLFEDKYLDQSLALEIRERDAVLSGLDKRVLDCAILAGDSGLGSYFHTSIANISPIFVANREAGVDKLRSSDIASMYEGEIRDWTHLGGSPIPVQPVAYSKSSSEQAALSQALGFDLEIASGTRLATSTAEMLRIVAFESGAFGYLFSAPGTADVMQLTVDTGEAASPRLFEVNNQLRIQLLFVSLDKPSGGCRQLLDFVLTSDIQRQISERR